MKAWVSIGVVFWIFLVAGLGSLIYRSLDADRGEGQLNLSEQARQGLQVAESLGCIACHTLDGRPGIGPTWQGMYGSIRTFQDGSSQIADEAYTRESITDPAVKVVAGFDNLMVGYPLSPDDMEAVLALLRELGSQP